MLKVYREGLVHGDTLLQLRSGLVRHYSVCVE